MMIKRDLLFNLLTRMDQIWDVGKLVVKVVEESKKFFPNFTINSVGVKNY